MSPKSYTSIDIDTPSTSKSNADQPKKMKTVDPPTRDQMLGVESKKEKKKKKEMFRNFKQFFRILFLNPF
jgi:hypothetical protein